MMRLLIGVLLLVTGLMRSPHTRQHPIVQSLRAKVGPYERQLGIGLLVLSGLSALELLFRAFSPFPAAFWLLAVIRVGVAFSMGYLLAGDELKRLQLAWFQKPSTQNQLVRLEGRVSRSEASVATTSLIFGVLGVLGM